MIAAMIASVAGGLLFVALGGVGLAQDTIAPAEDQDGVQALVPQSAGKVVICHKGKNTISVSVNAWQAHERLHGDTEGACVQAATTQTKAKKGKKAALSTTATVTAPATSTQEMKPTKKTKPSQAGATETAIATTVTEDSQSTPKAKPQKGPKTNKGQLKKQAMLAPISETDSPPGHANGGGPGSGNGSGHGKGNQK